MYEFSGHSVGLWSPACIRSRNFDKSFPHTGILALCADMRSQSTKCIAVAKSCSQISYLSFLSSSGKYDGKSILMVTDASGLPLGFDVLDDGWSCLCNADFTRGEGSGAMRTFYKIVTLLQRCMDAPMGGGMPRQPKRLRVNHKILHRWGRKISSRLT